MWFWNSRKYDDRDYTRRMAEARRELRKTELSLKESTDRYACTGTLVSETVASLERLI